MRAIAAAFAAAFRWFRDSIGLSALIDRIRTRLSAAADILDFAGFESALRGGFGAVADAVAAGGALGGAQIAAIVDSPFAFTIYADPPMRALRGIQDRLVRELSAEARQAVFGFVADAARRGESAASIAADIRASIGLTETQMRAVANFRRMLEAGDVNALTRDLRDPAFDAEFRRALRVGSKLEAARVDAMVAAYAERYLDYRAATIARTESVRAVNLGLHESYKQAVADGTFPKAAVRRYWQVNLDEKLCPLCRPVPDMNPNGVGVHEDFQTPLGPRAIPDLHPNERCSVEYRVNLDMLGERTRTREREAV
jgi:hypothetical protein